MQHVLGPFTDVDIKALGDKFRADRVLQEELGQYREQERRLMWFFSTDETASAVWSCLGFDVYDRTICVFASWCPATLSGLINAAVAYLQLFGHRPKAVVRTNQNVVLAMLLEKKFRICSVNDGGETLSLERR